MFNPAFVLPVDLSRSRGRSTAAAAAAAVAVPLLVNRSPAAMSFGMFAERNYFLSFFFCSAAAATAAAAAAADSFGSFRSSLHGNRRQPVAADKHDRQTREVPRKASGTKFAPSFVRKKTRPCQFCLFLLERLECALQQL